MELGLGDTEKRAPRYIVKVFITVIDIIMILHVSQKHVIKSYIAVFIPQSTFKL